LISEFFSVLYRIQSGELESLLERLLGIRIEAGAHEFIEVPDKLGAEGKVTLVADPKGCTLPRGQVYDSDGIGIYREGGRCALCYSSNIQKYQVHFVGTARSIKEWCEVLQSKPEAYATVFLHVFNRKRATGGLEKEAVQERGLLRDLIRDFRGPRGAQVALGRIAEVTKFDWAIVSVYGAVTTSLLPVAASEGGIVGTVGAVSVDALPHFVDVITHDKINVVDIEQSAGDTKCLCEVMKSKGARQAAFLRFGCDPFKGMARGLVCLYRRRPAKLNERDKTLIRYGAREVAAWLEEIDQRQEGQIVEQSVTMAQRYGGYAIVSGVNEEIFTVILRNLGRIVTDTIGAAFGGPFKEKITCGFIADARRIGDIPDAVKKWPFGAAGPQAMTLIPGKDGMRSILIPERPFALVVSSRAASLGLLRSHLCRWLFLLMKLAYQLVVLEERRLSSMQRTVHLIRQPLQGVVTMVSEICRLLNDASVPRKDILFYAEDMESSILRLRVLLEIFNNIAGISELSPKRRNVFIERDVLRPMRRLLGGHARKRGVELGDTCGYELVPTLVTDPDLLSIVFYNLLDNAIKYSEQGTEVRIFCSEARDHYFVEVSNKGPEIDAKEVDKVFNRWFRGINVKTREVGLGLGLFIAQEIASALGCAIELVSRGEGHKEVKFRLRIPKELQG
jgi:signal transduction histidine kinase